MDRVSAGYKRIFLRCVKADAAARALTLLAVLEEAATAQVKKTAGGITLISGSGNGHSYNILPNAGAGLTPLDFAEMLSDIMDRYDAAVVALTVEGEDAPTEAEIYTEIMRTLIAVNEVGSDFSGMTR